MASYDFLDPGEQILMEGAANKKQFLGVNKGGKLVLTNRRLVFIAHALNLGSKYDEISFSSIAVSGNTINLLLPTPNLIKVITKDGRTNEFVVTGKQKEEWKLKISQAIQIYKGQSS